MLRGLAQSIVRNNAISTCGCDTDAPVAKTRSGERILQRTTVSFASNSGFSSGPKPSRGAPRHLIGYLSAPPGKSACNVHRSKWGTNMNTRTKNNLKTAMECDALDAATYCMFAARARMDEDWELARLFQQTADEDRTEYFCKEAELEGLIANSAENLRNTIDAEMKEVKMFTQFARQATEDGDLGIASVFERISRDKAEQCSRFEAILSEMGVHSNFETVTG